MDIPDSQCLITTVIWISTSNICREPQLKSERVVGKAYVPIACQLSAPRLG